MQKASTAFGAHTTGQAIAPECRTEGHIPRGLQEYMRTVRPVQMCAYASSTQTARKPEHRKSSGLLRSPDVPQPSGDGMAIAQIAAQRAPVRFRRFFQL